VHVRRRSDVRTRPAARTSGGARSDCPRTTGPGVHPTPRSAVYSGRRRLPIRPNPLAAFALIAWACTGPAADKPTGDDDDTTTTGDDDDTTTGDDDDDTTTPVVSPLDPDAPPVTDGDWARPGTRTTWQIQLQGPPNLDYDADVYVLDLFDVPDAVFDALHADGRLVGCYLSAGSFEPWRDDVGDLPPDVIGEPLAEHPDEAWLDIRRAEVHDLVRARLDLAATRGCDGVVPDNVDAWLATSGFPLTERDQLGFDRFVLNEAHQRDLFVALQDDLPQVPDLVDYADVAIVERCHEAGTCDALAPFQDAGKPVLDAEYLAEYLADPPAFCRTAIIAGTRSLLLSPLLDDSVRVACDTDFPEDTRLAGVLTYTTYYGREPERIAELAGLDLAVVQPLLTPDQRAVLQARAEIAVYLSIGEIGLSNTYLVGGEEVLGQVIFDDHPEWFLGMNPFFDSWFADANQVGWRAFVRDQADLLLAQGYDGLFLDTVDTVDVYPEVIPGMIALIEELRADHPDAVLIQNRGINVIPDTGPTVDALMFEVFSTTYDWNAGAYVQTDTLAPGYAELVDKAVDYRLTGGVVLAQDFAEPGGAWDDLICYGRDRGLAHLFVPAYADALFQGGLYASPATCPWPEGPRLGLSFAPGAAHTAAGRTVRVTAALAGDNGFASPTTLALGPAPTGLTATLPDAQATAADPAEIEITADPAAAAGTYRLPLLATSGDEARTFELAVVVHDETVWVTNAGLSQVVAFDEPEALAAPALPSRRTGGVVAQPYAIAVGASGAQWVVENVGDPAAAQPAGRVLRYAPFALDAPDLIVDTGLSYPTGIAIDAAGTVYVASSGLDWTGTERDPPAIVTIDPTSGAVATALRFDTALGPPSLGYPRSLAFDPAGQLWMTTTYGLLVGYALPAADPPVPFAVIAGAGGGSGDVYDTLNDVTFDADGDPWVSGTLAGAARLVEIPAGAWATDGTTTWVDPSTVGAVVTQGLFVPWGLRFDRTGDLWAVDTTDAADAATSRGSLVRFGGGSLGLDPAPDVVIRLDSRYTLGLAVGTP
jgi:hypothetical protein